MEPEVELQELMERIRLASERENTSYSGPPEIGGSSSERSPHTESLPKFIKSAVAAGTLDQAEHLLPRAHQKNAVSSKVPKWLRPLFRNQGGVNGVVLHILECLANSNRQIVEEMGAHEGWADAVRHEATHTRGWMAATNVRLQKIDEECLQIDGRLGRLEQQDGHGPGQNAPLEPATGAEQTGGHRQSEARLTGSAERAEMIEKENARLRDLVELLQIQLGQQMDYTRAVHGHLDGLGQHVESSLARLHGQAASMQEQLTRLVEQIGLL